MDTGEVYEGNGIFTENNINGQGKYIMPNGHIILGEWKNSFLHG